MIVVVRRNACVLMLHVTARDIPKVFSSGSSKSLNLNVTILA